MQDEDEIRQAMRAALNRLRDQALAELSAPDRRLVSIAQGPTTADVQHQIVTLRRKLLMWPVAQAFAGCAVLAAVCAAGLHASLSGDSLGVGGAMFAALGLAALPVPVAQLIAQTRHE